MENTTKAGLLYLPKIKILRVVMLAAFAFIICRGPLLDGMFPIGVSFIAYMLCRNIVNLYLIIPAILGILPYITRGYDPWGEMIAMAVCGMLFTAARRINLELWQRALIAAAIGIVCISIYRLASHTVYQSSPEALMAEGAIIFAMVFVLDAFWRTVENGWQKTAQQREDWEFGTAMQNAAIASDALTAGSFSIICIMLINGVGLFFLIWPVILFLSLWALTEPDTGGVNAAFSIAVSGSIAAALAGQEQWGLLATVMIGLLAANLVRKYGTLFMTVVFSAVCWLTGVIKSGVVLGADGYCLFLAAAAFLTLNWRFRKPMKHIICTFAGSRETFAGMEGTHIEQILKDKTAEMEELAELYASYLDSRSILAGQFSITNQIMQDIRWQLNRQSRRATLQAHEKLQLHIAVSQCAAAGEINGDCCGWQDIGNGKVALVVSDGMGKGKKAAAESLMVTRTILSLLKSGVTTDLTLKMINTVMLMKEDEDFYATVDLAIIDKKTGKTKFYKIGAAPTLIRRKNNVEEVRLSAVPLGIVNGLKIRYMETILKKDDWIIMMSDGVSDGGGGRVGSEGWISRDAGGFLHRIKEAAADVRSNDPHIMSDLLLNHAADSYIGRERDDLTVMVAHIT